MDTGWKRRVICSKPRAGTVTVDGVAENGAAVESETTCGVAQVFTTEVTRSSRQPTSTAPNVAGSGTSRMQPASTGVG